MSTGCGWYEYGLYDVAIALTEVPLKPYELEYRERTIFSPIQPEPVEIPSNQPQPVVLKVKAKPKACAPPHPSTVRVCYVPEAVPFPQPAANDLHHQDSNGKTEKREKSFKSQDKIEKSGTMDTLTKEERKREKTEKSEKTEKADKTEKTDKGEKHRKEKHEKHEKEKKKGSKDPITEGALKEE